MIATVAGFLRRFREDQSGSVTLIEFVIMVPLIFSAFMMSVEMGIYSMRQMFLDRGLDMTVRFVRLNTDTPMTHDQLKTMICANAGFIEDCSTSLKLEMMPLDPRNFATFDQAASCVDTSAPVEPDRGMNPGREHELMILRACVRFAPVFPTTGLGAAFGGKDSSGKARMVAVNAFVQEPG